MGDENAIGKFLSNMGHNVKSATHTERVNDYEETQGQENEDPDISNWILRTENSMLERFRK